jgi:hypothetical protein
VFDDTEAKSQSAVVSGGRRISPAKALENMGKKIGLDTLTGIRNVQLEVRVNSLKDNLHSTAARSEFDRVGQQIPDDLLKPAGIAGNRARFRVNHGNESQPFHLRRWSNRLAPTPSTWRIAK